VDFDQRAWRAQFHARQEALSQGSETVGARHLLLGLLRLENGLLGQVLSAFGEEGLSEKVAQFVRSSLGRSEHASSSSSRRRPARSTTQWDEVLQWAKKRAQDEGRALVGEADLIQALLAGPSNNNNVHAVLAKAGAQPQQCLEVLGALVSQGGGVPSVWHDSGFEP
jgi:ATP-dependent Clp protease ATP-binding subunit ClpA